MDDISLFLTVVMMGLAAILSIISFASWFRIKHSKFLIVGIAFFLFFLKGCLLLIEILTQNIYAILLDFLIIILFYISIAKR